MPTDNANIARHLACMAERQPAVAALKIPRGRNRVGNIDYLTLSFAELAAEVAAYQADFTARGVRPTDRVLVMVRPGLPLIASAFALFSLGAVPIVIDPGMGLKSFLACVTRSQPRVLLGIPLARVISHVYRNAFRTVELRVPARSSATARKRSVTASVASIPLSAGGRDSCAPAATAPTDLAAILFTSGSTGAPKGVCYTHGMFDAQVELIRATYDIRPGEIDLPLLPLFALFNPALGMTTIVPEIDPSRPATLDPRKIVQAIRQENVTNSFGSPTLWRKIAVHCKSLHIELPTMRRVLCAGAPVPPDLWDLMTPVLPHGTLHSPYGATEALPVSSISAPEVLTGTAAATAQGAGTCVGRPLPANEVKIIALRDTPIKTLSAAREQPVGHIGEIIVRGPSVTQAYDHLADATLNAKIQDDSSGRSTVWHRLGDVGYLDNEGRLWFCGRKAERVETAQGPLYTEQVEPLLNAHAHVRRCALIGLGEPGRQRPAVVVEPLDWTDAKTSSDCRRFARELRLLARNCRYTEGINLFYFIKKFPVDVRHNAKIHRLTLARWAQTAKGYTSDPKR